MLLAIISDIHDNLANLEKLLSWCRNHKVKKLIFCGDATTIETIIYLSTNFHGKIFMVSGNSEIYQINQLKKYTNLDYFGEAGIKRIAALKIGLCHKPQKIKYLLKLTANDLDFIFYGHTHKPALTQSDSTLIVNPGNIAGIFYQPTFASLETNNKKLELKILANL